VFIDRVGVMTDNEVSLQQQFREIVNANLQHTVPPASASSPPLSVESSQQLLSSQGPEHCF